jgi:branched-chain amino acid transport system substrate-binding protein
MTIRRALLPVALATAMLGDVAACSEKSSPKVTPDAAAGAIVLGFSVSLTGGNAGVGAALRDGTQTAIDLLNAKGGVLGRPLLLDVKDDASNNTTQGDRGAVLRGIIQGFVDRPVTAILGPGASVQLQDAQAWAFPRQGDGAPVPGKNPTLVISAWSTSPAISQAQAPWPERFLYRTAPSDLLQRRAMFKLMTEDPPPSGADAGPAGPQHKCRAPFLIYGDDLLGKGFFDYLPGAFQRIGIAMKFATVPTNVIGDYSGPIAEIIAARADCVAFVTYADVAAAIIPKLKETMTSTAGYPADAYFIGVDAHFDTKFIEEVKKTNGDAIEGMVGTVPDTSPQTSQYSEFRTIFQTHTGTADEPPAYSANAFDAAILLGLALQKAQSFDDTRKIRDALVEVSRGYPGGAGPSSGTTPKLITPATLDDAFPVLRAGGTIDYYGASGPVNFDDTGDVVTGYVSWIIKKGQFQTLTRYRPTELPE